MYLNEKHKYIWCLCVPAVICLLTGYLLRTQSDAHIGTDNVFFAPETTTMIIAEDSVTVPEPPSAAGYEGVTEQIGPTTEVEASATEYEHSRRLENAGRFFSMLGFLCLAAFVIIFPFASPLLGPELELSLCGVCAFYLCCIAEWRLGAFASGLVYAALCTVLAVCIKGLVSWGCAKFSSRFSLIQRLLTRILSRGGTGVGGIIVLSVCSFMAACASLIFAGETIMLYIFDSEAQILSLPLAAGCCVTLFFALKSDVKYSRSVKSLTGQIQTVTDNGTAVVSDGYFAQSEAQLAEIGKKRDEAVKRAIADERFRVELITNVSHDLRTPLTSVLGYAELLKSEELSPEGRKQLEKLNEKAGYMRDMVEELFELTKVSSGEKEAVKEPLDLVRLMEQTVGLFDDALSAGGLTVKRHYDVQNSVLLTDGAMLHRVLDNLLSNAVKYSPENARIHIYIDQENGRFRIRIINTANYEMDFDEEEITKRFVRGDKTRSTSGSGLGLAIAKTYTEKLGGSFSVRAEGEQFTAELLF